MSVTAEYSVNAAAMPHFRVPRKCARPGAGAVGPPQRQREGYRVKKRPASEGKRILVPVAPVIGESQGQDRAISQATVTDQRLSLDTPPFDVPFSNPYATSQKKAVRGLG